MATKDFIAAIEFSSSVLSGIAGHKRADGQIEVFAYASVNATPFVRKGIVYNIDKAAQAIDTIVDRLEQQLGCPIAKVYAGIGGQSVRTIQNRVDRMLDTESVISQELIDSICDENLQLSLPELVTLDVAPQECRIDGGLYADPVGVTGTHVEGSFLNIVARPALRKNVELSFGQARVKLADLTVAPIAVAHTMLTETEMRSGCALVDFGADTTTLSVYKNGLLRHLCVIPLGGSSITRDLTTLQVEEEEAERLKLRYGDARYQPAATDECPTCGLDDGRTVDMEKLCSLVGARAEELLENVWHQIELSGYEGNLYAGVIFTGGGSRLKHLEDAFRQRHESIKVKTVNTPHTPFVPCDGLPDEGPRAALLGIVSTGTDNCCAEQAEQTANKRPVGQTSIGFEQEAEEEQRTSPHPDNNNTSATPPTEEKKPEQSTYVNQQPRKPTDTYSPDSSENKPRKQTKKRIWKTFFEMLDDKSDEM